MTSGQRPTPSPARLGGLALIGVGAVASAIGVITVLSSGAQNTAAGEQPSAVPTPPLAVSPVPKPGQGDQPTPVPTNDGRTTPALPPQPTQVPPPPNNTEHPVPRIVVRVYNNSTIPGLAHQAADDFRRAGYDVPEVGNYPGGIVYTTTVYFRPGTDEEAQAREVAARIGARLEPRFAGIEAASPGVIAIITNDYKAPQNGK